MGNASVPFSPEYSPDAVDHLRGLSVRQQRNEEPEPVVLVLAVGVKDRNVVRIGGEVIVL
jgi:hypothetical protein